MASKEIRQKIIELQEIINLWFKFYNMIKEVYDSKAVTMAQEEEFLNIKTTLAKKQQTLLTISSLRLINILSQATSLADMLKFADIQARKFYTDWHEAYLSLNELLGRLESGKLEVETLKPSLIKPKRLLGCLYNLVLLIIFIALAYGAFYIYHRKYNPEPLWFEKYFKKSDKNLSE